MERPRPHRRGDELSSGGRSDRPASVTQSSCSPDATDKTFPALLRPGNAAADTVANRTSVLDATIA